METFQGGELIKTGGGWVSAQPAEMTNQKLSFTTVFFGNLFYSDSLRILVVFLAFMPIAILRKIPLHPPFSKGELIYKNLSFTGQTRSAEW